MKRIKTDILVIGAGSGGLSVAAGASQMGADVVLLEASSNFGSDDDAGQDFSVLAPVTDSRPPRDRPLDP